jgi:hypothetical protein
MEPVSPASGTRQPGYFEPEDFERAGPRAQIGPLIQIGFAIAKRILTDAAVESTND